MHRLPGVKWNHCTHIHYHYYPLHLNSNARLWFSLFLTCSVPIISWIWRGNEWKMVSSMTSGHYQYQVMLYGLSSAPLVFQCFIIYVLRDFLGRFVIAYIDDILIYTCSNLIMFIKYLLNLYVKGEKCKFHVSLRTLQSGIRHWKGRHYHGSKYGLCSHRVVFTGNSKGFPVLHEIRQFL